MNTFLDYRLFRIGGADVTVASLAASLAILAVSFLFARIARKLVAERLLARTRLNPGVRYAIGRILSYVVLFLGFIVALQPLGINATTLAVFGGALGIGLGFGLQDIVKNFVAGLIILIERPVKVGDRIELDGCAGDVVEIRARATVVRTNDDIFLIVPNSRFITETVTNWSFRSSRVRFRFPVSVSDASDPRQAEAALLEAASRSSSLLKDPAPSVLFRGFGDTSLDFDLVCWTSLMLHRGSALRSELNFLIHEALTSRGIPFPTPQRDLILRRAHDSPPLFPEGGEDPPERREPA